MLIDQFDKNWQVSLREKYAGLEKGYTLYLLIDGAFIPDIYLAMQATLSYPETLILLFQKLPSCSAHTRSVSPFIIKYVPASIELAQILEKCSGWPMISVIETNESITALGKRLAAWCIVENESQLFNFRFPDTRRLAKIFAVFSQSQRDTFGGPSVSWAYMNRCGVWKELPIISALKGPTERAALNSDQFSEILNDSLTDEMIDLLKNIGINLNGNLSSHHRFIEKLLTAALKEKLNPEEQIEWCLHSVTNENYLNNDTEIPCVKKWISERP